MNSGSGQEGSSQRASGSGSAVPHRSGHRHSQSQNTHNSPWERSDAERSRPSFPAPSQSAPNNVAPPRTVIGRKKAVARKSTGMIPPRHSQPTPKELDPFVKVPEEGDPDPLSLEDIRRLSGARHQNLQASQSSPARPSSNRSAASASTSTQRTRFVRPKIRLVTLSGDQRAKAKRPDIPPRPDRKQPPPPGAEIVEISSDDEQPATASHVSTSPVPAPAQRPRTSGRGNHTARLRQAPIPETIDLTMDDSGNEGISAAFLPTPAAVSAHESIAPAINSPSAAPSFIQMALNPELSPAHPDIVTHVTSPPLTPGLSSTQIPIQDRPSATFGGLIPAHVPDVYPSNAFSTPPPSTAPAISPLAIPGLTPRRSAPHRSPSATRPSKPPIFLTDRRTPMSPSPLAAKIPSHGLTPAPVGTHSPLPIAMGWDRATQGVLDTPIEDEDHRLDVDMGDDVYRGNVHTSGSTPLQATTTDEERTPPGTPNGEDMELDVDVLNEGDSVSVVPVQGPVPVTPVVVTPIVVSFLSSPSRPLASAPPEHIRPVVLDVTPEFPAARSQSAPILSKPGSEAAPASALHPISTVAADESDVVEESDATMGASSGDGRVSPVFHAGALPRRLYTGFEPSEDELAGDVTTECSSISAPVSDIEEMTHAATTGPSDPTDGLTSFAKEIYSNILENNPNDAAYYACMSRKYPGEKLDTRIVDMMNALPEPWKQDVTTRINFESYMMSSVAAYNPWSPPIKVINNVDAQPNPPWEFVYTERMVYGNGVKKPTKEERRARGCDCYPHCKPNDRNCACLRRQEKYGKEVDLKGFRYNRDGRLTFIDPVPIFECTDGCRCNEDCPNRVAQYGRTKKIALEKTVNKGWGVVALEPIPAGSFLGVYSGELLLPCELEVREAFYNTYGRTYTFEMDFHYLKQRGRKRGKKTSAKYAIDAFHAGCFTRYLNHSCDPNCVIIPVVYGEATEDTPYLGFYTRFDVKEGEGLEFSYKGVPDEEQVTNLARAARFRKKKERAIAAGQKFDTTSALCQCGAKNCDGSMWQWEHEKNEDEGEISGDGMGVNEGDGEVNMQSIGVLDDPNDGEYEGSDDELDELESDDEEPPRIELL